MTISTRPKPYIIPEYSLTGDLLSYLTCGLQYRYQNKGSLPPSRPVQLWFGEFIHAVMEEAYLTWRDKNKRRFDWDWLADIRPIEEDISRMLSARNLDPPPHVFCPYLAGSTKRGTCPDFAHPHKLVASERAHVAINTWGKHLFPLVSEAEVKMKGLRDMPSFNPGVSRSNYYGVTGVIDVLSSINLESAPTGNLLLHYVDSDPQLQIAISSLANPEYEVIIDYKGMRRPSTTQPVWIHHEWQILTYAWLRMQQPGARKVVAGVLLYLNELAPSKGDIDLLKVDERAKSTDVLPTGTDRTKIRSWNPKLKVPKLSSTFREKRSIRLVAIDPRMTQSALSQFDKVVDEVETSVCSETAGKPIQLTWKTVPDRRTCTACDFKTHCPDHMSTQYKPTVP